MSKNPNLAILVGIAISVVSLWIAFRHTNLNELATTLSQAHYWMAFPMLVAYGIFYWLKLLRWKIILKPIKDASQSRLFSPMMLGFFGNNILPAHMGEFIRMYLAAKDLNLSNTQVLATLILERIFDILTIVVILAGILLYGVNLSPELEIASYYAAGISLSLIGSIIIATVWTETCVHITNKLLFFLPCGLRSTIIKHLELGLRSFHSIKSLSLLLPIIATSLLQWIFMGITIYIALLSVDISASLAASFVVLSFTVFAVIIPAAPGFFGTIQLAFVLSLTPFDITESDAIAASISFHFVTYFSVLLLGFYLLHKRGEKIKTLSKNTELNANAS